MVSYCRVVRIKNELSCRQGFGVILANITISADYPTHARQVCVGYTSRDVVKCILFVD